MSESGAAGEIAKAAGKGIDAARELGGFVARLIGGPLDQASGMVQDKLLYMRLERQLRLRDRFFAVLAERGLSGPTRSIPLKLAVPLLQAASMEDNDDLQDLWVNLLANTSDADSGVETRRVFVDILSNFTTLDALIFDRIYSIQEINQDKEMWTLYLPEKVVFEKPDVENFRPPPDVELSLANLVRNGCLNTAVAWGGIQITSIINQTIIGRHLHQACARAGRKRSATNS